MRDSHTHKSDGYSDDRPRRPLIAVQLNVDAQALRRTLMSAALLLALSAGVYVLASNVTIPNVFTNGTVADADQVNANFNALASAVNGNDSRLDVLDTAITVNGGNVGIGNPTPAEKLVVNGIIQSTTGGVKFPDGTIQTTAFKVHQGGPVYRWCVFSSYDQAGGWFDGNNTRYFGGITPSIWGDGNANVTNLTSDKDILRTIFTNKGYGGKNAVIYNQNWYMYSSTDTHNCLVLFRILNTTAGAIDWPVWWNTTSMSGWGNWAYAMINGTQVDGVADAYAYQGPRNINISVPAGPTRVSTVVFQSSGSNPSGNYRSAFLAFTNDCLVLPAGLQYVDDLDTATGDWTQ